MKTSTVPFAILIAAFVLVPFSANARHYASSGIVRLTQIADSGPLPAMASSSRRVKIVGAKFAGDCSAASFADSTCNHDSTAFKSPIMFADCHAVQTKWVGSRAIKDDCQIVGAEHEFETCDGRRDITVSVVHSDCSTTIKYKP
jgi:hypothetical protein